MASAPDESENPKKSTKKRRPRFDLYKDIRQYYGEPVLASRQGRVPSLFEISILYVIREKIQFGNLIPTVLGKTLEEHRKYEGWIGPKVIKCSRCGKLYTTQQKFEKHTCEMFYGNPHV